MGMEESGWEECVVVPVVPHSVAAILQMVGAPWFMVDVLSGAFWHILLFLVT